MPKAAYVLPTESPSASIVYRKLTLLELATTTTTTTTTRQQQKNAFPYFTSCRVFSFLFFLFPFSWSVRRRTTVHRATSSINLISSHCTAQDEGEEEDGGDDTYLSICCLRVSEEEEEKAVNVISRFIFQLISSSQKKRHRPNIVINAYLSTAVLCN